MEVVHGRSHQFVVGGYYGIGMVKTFGAGQMAVKLVMGEQVGDGYPQTDLVTKARVRMLRDSLTQGKDALRSKS